MELTMSPRMFLSYPGGVLGAAPCARMLARMDVSEETKRRLPAHPCRAGPGPGFCCWQIQPIEDCTCRTTIIPSVLERVAPGTPGFLAMMSARMRAGGI